jgi:hypothetical protein
LLESAFALRLKHTVGVVNALEANPPTEREAVDGAGVRDSGVAVVFDVAP